MTYISFGNLSIDENLFNFVNNELLSGLNIDLDKFWADFEKATETLTPKNQQLLQKREKLQKELNGWLDENKASGIDSEQYTIFLKEIGYLLPEGSDFQIETSNIDDEISTIAGPQLVVPVMNARYALNAANARWGSLYDALYGTDVISEDDDAKKSTAYNPIRGEKVISYARGVLDVHSPLKDALWKDVTGFSVSEGSLLVFIGKTSTTLEDNLQFSGYRGSTDKPDAISVSYTHLTLPTNSGV